ncbi:hypothetical protein GCM10023313_13200 [Mucilaginibacter defluvii]|uniref:Fimbrillin-A associated anchor protein Mfa1/Mfa2 n=2 Tax=Mucilaginibacter defluvii TaxID=1196019 RepID=A0ABP9FP93_9SPHI
MITYNFKNMKAIYNTIAIAILTTIASCKKDAKPTPSDNNKEYEVNFTVSGFTKEYSGVKTNAVGDTAIREDNDYKFYRVFHRLILNSAGAAVGNYVTTTDGSIKVKLQPGNYTIYCAAGLNDDTRGLSRQEKEGAVYGTLVHSGKSSIAFYYDTSFYPSIFRETFAKSIAFTVGQSNQALNIVLERVVAQVQLNIKDAIPSNVKYIYTRVSPAKHVYNWGSEPYVVNDDLDSADAGARFTITSGLSGKSNLRFATYALVDANSKHNVTIEAVDANDKVIASKALTGVTCNPNQITLLTGNLFGGNGTATGTNVKVDSTWNSNIVYKSF